MSITMPSASTSPLPATAIADQQAIHGNPAGAVFNTALGFIASACLNVAVKFRIPDLIGAGYTNLANLALKAGAQQEPLFRTIEADREISPPTSCTAWAIIVSCCFHPD